MSDHIVTGAASARRLHAVRPGALGGWRAARDPASTRYLDAIGFAAKSQELALLDGPDGLEAVLGLGSDRSPHAFGDLAHRLPEGVWRLETGDFSMHDAVLGFCLGGYRYAAFKQAKRAPAQLLVADPPAAALSAAAATAMVRDLINAPANVLGPAELADAVLALASKHGCETRRIEGAALAAAYPAIAAVGAGSQRAPVMAAFDWRGSGAAADAPLVSLCGKGVCFDTGGYDLKPSAAMLRMKKDMGGAATLLGLARMVMEADLKLRLSVRVGCVENSVSGSAMRPSDVIATRRGLSVEIGNTDAEGRLVLCDLLAEAADEQPDLLIDAATLTGAARVALGPDLPALFCTDDTVARFLTDSGTHVHDPLWRLPLWDGYERWLDSSVADMNNVSSKPLGGAITAALFLRRFIGDVRHWAHLDLYAWNDAASPGRPEGGEAYAMRALFAALAAPGLTAHVRQARTIALDADQNSKVT